jgi:predicted unusual protein kinase regulating ubiquinone biosynthesis (AarF/ABC1/UbiB family)
MTFILKSLTTLDGVAKALDPEYNLLVCAQPFVKSLTVSQRRGRIVGELAKQTRDFIKYKLQQPSKAEVLIQSLQKRIEDGELQLRVRTLESDRLLKRINLALKSLIYATISGFSVLSASVLLNGGYLGGAIAAFSVSVFGLFILLRSLFKLSVRERLDRMTEK